MSSSSLKWRSHVIQNWRDQQTEQFFRLFFHSGEFGFDLVPHESQILQFWHFQIEPKINYNSVTLIHVVSTFTVSFWQVCARHVDSLITIVTCDNILVLADRCFATNVTIITVNTNPSIDWNLIDALETTTVIMVWLGTFHAEYHLCFFRFFIANWTTCRTYVTKCIISIEPEKTPISPWWPKT